MVIAAHKLILEVYKEEHFEDAVDYCLVTARLCNDRLALLFSTSKKNGFSHSPKSIKVFFILRLVLYFHFIYRTHTAEIHIRRTWIYS